MASIHYDQDYYGWTLQQAALLRAGKLSEIDIQHLAEEIESLGRSERRQLTNRLEVLLLHLLKWCYQPHRREIDGNSWLRSIREQRRRIPKLLRDNPSLQSVIAACLADAYDDARYGASDETGLPISTFPETCPYTFEQVLEQNFLPV
ncbi:MAG: DUF29 domain-containing protein [Candidatus Competibacteraceae bacterium]